jgi:hypothetical protein
MKEGRIETNTSTHRKTTRKRTSRELCKAMPFAVFSDDVVCGLRSSAEPNNQRGFVLANQEINDGAFPFVCMQREEGGSEKRKRRERNKEQERKRKNPLPP